MQRQRTRKIPKSLSFSQVVARVLIASAMIFLLIFIAILVNHWYLYTHSNGPAKIVSSAHPKLQPQPKSEPSPAPSAPAAEAKQDTPLTFYDSLVHKETPDSTSSSVPSEPKACYPLRDSAYAGRKRCGERAPGIRYRLVHFRA